MTFLLWVSLPFLGAASSFNAFLMRKHELKDGIEVVDEEGNVVGTSQIAAKNVSVFTREFMPFMLQLSLL